jgi:hypothetical protein
MNLSDDGLWRTKRCFLKQCLRGGRGVSLSRWVRDTDLSKTVGCLLEGCFRGGTW